MAVSLMIKLRIIAQNRKSTATTISTTIPVATARTITNENDNYIDNDKNSNDRNNIGI